jgi:arsenate reductase (thioredoxin)
MKKFVFACVHNAGRSQMAGAFFNALADRRKAFAVSAGSEPAKAVHPEVLTVMQEIGIDLSGAVPQLLTEELVRDADSLITMGCGDKCPYVPGVKRADWKLADPKGQSLETVRETRDAVKKLVEQLIAEHQLN